MEQARAGADPSLDDAISRERAERLAVQRARLRLALLAEASRVLAEERAVGSALQAIAAAARRAVCDGCAIELQPPAAVETRAVTADEPELALRVALDRLLQPVGTAGAAVASAGAGSQVTEPLCLETAKTFRRFGYRSVLAVPVLQQGRPCGLIAFFARQEHRFGAADVVVAEDLSSRIALALEGRARQTVLESALRERDTRLDTLRRDLGTSLPALALDLGALAESVPGADLRREIERIAASAAAVSRRLAAVLAPG